MFKTALSLVFIGALCASVLVGTDRLTGSTIEQNRELRARSLMQTMLSASLQRDDQDDLVELANIDRAIFGDCRAWVFQRIHTPGYAGPIHLLALWHAAAQGLVMRVTEHRETPGIGDFIDHNRNPWITALDQSTVTALRDFDNVSGATVTTAAIRRAALDTFLRLEKFCGD